MDVGRHFCAPLGERSTLEEVGGKAYHLWRAKQLGAGIPDTWVIHRSALKLALQETGLQAAVEGYLQSLNEDGFDHIETRYEGLVRLFESRCLPQPLADELEALSVQCFERAPVGLAIRSSAVVEDSKEASFSGVFRSWIGVQTFEGLVDCLWKCWLASWSPKAMRYMDRVGVRPVVDGMAVMLQPVLDACESGVAYTANPDSGNPAELVITATRGLAMDLMDGDGSGDRLMVDWSTGRRISETVAEKLIRLVPGAAGVERRQEEASEARLPALRPEQVDQLVLQTRELDRGFSFRVDVEFVFDPDGLKIVQVRPLTALPEYFPEELPKADRTRAWDRMEYVIPFREDVPKGLVTPLFADLADAEMWRRYQPDDITLGVYCQETRDVGGYRYHASGKMPIFSDYFDDVDSMEAWLLQNESRYRERWDGHRAELDTIVALAKEALAEPRNLSWLISAWLRVRDQLWDLNSFGWSGPQYLGWMCESVLGDFIKRWDIDMETATLMGGAESFTYEATLNLQELGRFSCDPKLRDLLLSGPLDQMMEAILDEHADSEFLRAFESWAWRFGKRPPCWFQRASFWKHGTDHIDSFHSIRCVMKGDSQDVARTRLVALENRLAAEKRICECLESRKSEEEDRFLRILEWTRYWGEALNDRHSLGIGLQWEYELIWEMGMSLLRSGYLNRPEDILALTREDLVALQQGEKPIDFGEHVERKVADYQLRLRFQAPESLGLSLDAKAEVPPQPEESTSTSKTQLIGDGIGSTCVTGTARIVKDLKDPELLAQLRATDILVLPGANDFHYADWHSLLTLVGGVVAISQASHHLAQVARECGVPIVGNVGQAVILAGGETVSVDARRGVVEIVG